MAKKNFEVQCAHCNKPFHFIPPAGSDEPGEIEMALACPFCQTRLIVNIPRGWGGKETILRGSAPQKFLTSRKAES